MWRLTWLQASCWSSGAKEAEEWLHRDGGEKGQGEREGRYKDSLVRQDPLTEIRHVSEGQQK